jgi:hypothetical protein
MALELRKPVTRRVEIPGYGSMNITLAPEGIRFRPYKARTTWVLPYGPAVLRAATLAADSKRARRRKTVKRSAL